MKLLNKNIPILKNQMYIILEIYVGTYVCTYTCLHTYACRYVRE